MKFLTSRSGVVALVTVIQLALVPLAVAGPLSARLAGDEYLLEVAPVDPIDPFRGAYVALSYPGLQDRDAGERWDFGEHVYVPLERSGDVWVGLPATTERPESQPFLRCETDYSQLRCGIESWFLPQEKALALERAVSSGSAVARIRIDSRGNASLVDVEIRR